MKLNGAAGFKLGAVRKAIVGMQSLDFKITDGVMLTKKNTKVQGIGKSTAAKIDEFLETGMISKVEDLRALVGEA